MNYEQNPIAKTVKVYAGINFAACLLLWFYLITGDILYGALSIVWLAASVVVNFGIYILGEVIQLLDDIKQNTRSSAQAAEAESAAVAVSDELPEL